MKKLGLDKVDRAFLFEPPERYIELLSDWSGTFVATPDDRHDWIQGFFRRQKVLVSEVPKLKKRLSSHGQLWISWPKKSSKLESDLDGNTVRSIGLATGLVDVKVAAFDEDWSGLKFVYRREDR